MRRQLAWLVFAVLLGAVGGVLADGVDESSVVAELTAADHESEEGYFSVGEGTTVIARPGSDLHRWLASHRGQKVRLVVESTFDSPANDPSRRPGLGRDTGEISRRRP